MRPIVAFQGESGAFSEKAIEYLVEGPVKLLSCNTFDATAGAVVQVTAASFDGSLGRTTARCAHRLLELDLVHLIASDAHAPGLPECGMAEAVATVGGGELGAWLSEAVPAALLAGEELPPRPARATR